MSSIPELFLSTPASPRSGLSISPVEHPFNFCFSPFFSLLFSLAFRHLRRTGPFPRNPPFVGEERRGATFECSAYLFRSLTLYSIGFKSFIPTLNLATQGSSLAGSVVTIAVPLSLVLHHLPPHFSTTFFALPLLSPHAIACLNLIPMSRLDPLFFPPRQLPLFDDSSSAYEPLSSSPRTIKRPSTQ